MNPSVNDFGEQATDKLLFQYLEGELTDEQTRTLEAWLAADPALRSELELWQAAFVTPDAQDTTALEARLLKEPVPPAGMNGFRWVPGLVLVAALFLTSFLTMFLLCERSLMGEKRLHLPPAAENAAPAPATSGIKPRVRTPDRAPQPVIVAAPERVISGNKTFSPNREDRPPVAVPVLAAAPMPVVVPQKPVITLQAIPAPEGVGLGYAKEQPVKKVKVPVVRTLTRQQQRAVSRLKRRAIQQRKANEFLKGNVPYVVPLNPNSF
jgi:hypothetical protein